MKVEIPPISRSFLTSVFALAIPCTVVLGYGIQSGVASRRRRNKKLRERHEERIKAWLKKLEEEKLCKKEYDEEVAAAKASEHQLQQSQNENFPVSQTGTEQQVTLTDAELEISRFRIDVEKLYQLWFQGKSLQCSPDLQIQMLTLLGEEWKLDLQECLSCLHADFMFQTVLAEIVHKVHAARAQKQIGEELWKEAEQEYRRCYRNQLKQFFKLLFVGSKARVLSLVVTALFSVLTSSLDDQRRRSEKVLLDFVGCTNMGCSAGDGCGGGYIDRDPSLPIYWCMKDLVLGLVLACVEYFSTWLVEYFAGQSSYDLWHAFYMKLIEFDQEFLDKHVVEEMLAVKDVEPHIQAAEDAVRHTLHFVASFMTRGWLIYRRSPRLIVYVLIFWTFSYFLQKKLSNLGVMIRDWKMEDPDETSSNEITEASSRANIRIDTMLAHMKVIRCCGRQEDLMKRIAAEQIGETSLSARKLWLPELLQYQFPVLSSWIVKGIRLLCKYCVSQLILQGYFTPNQEEDVHTLVDEGFNQLTALKSTLYVEFLFKHAPDAAMVMNILDFKPRIEVRDGSGYIPKKVVGTIEFVNVTFSYPARPDFLILRDFSLKITPGKMFGVAGPSGSGKSTMMALLLRIYDPQKGRILFDGRDLREFNILWLRRHLFAVEQTTVLFDMTIEDNIRFCTPSASRAEVMEAAKQAMAYEFIMALPEGFSTMVGEKAVQLSAGQMQRIGLARAFIMRPSVLLLDEITAALDPASERGIQEALQKLHDSVGCTIICIAHRLSNIRYADQIVFVKDGRCTEQGTHDQLIELNRDYAALFNASMLSAGQGSSPTTQNTPLGTNFGFTVTKPTPITCQSGMSSFCADSTTAVTTTTSSHSQPSRAFETASVDSAGSLQTAVSPPAASCAASCAAAPSGILSPSLPSVSSSAQQQIQNALLQRYASNSNMAIRLRARSPIVSPSTTPTVYPSSPLAVIPPTGVTFVAGEGVGSGSPLSGGKMAAAWEISSRQLTERGGGIGLSNSPRYGPSSPERRAVLSPSMRVTLESRGIGGPTPLSLPPVMEEENKTPKGVIGSTSSKSSSIQRTTS